MLDHIRFELMPCPHPYPAEPGSELQLWGKITIVVVRNSGRQLLYETEWDLMEFAEWFANNQSALCSEYFVVQDATPAVLPGESLAQLLRRLLQYECDDDDVEQQWFTQLYEFRSRHVLSFAMRGSQVPA